MMKSIKTWLLTVAALLGSISAYAHDFSVDGIYYDITSDATVEVTFRGYYYSSYDNEYSGDIIIPSIVTYSGKEYSVTSIGDGTFYDCLGLTSVTVPNSVTSIEEIAFSGCSGLTSVDIPNSVTSIGDCAFSGCSGLTEMKVDANNSKYDSREGCNAIIETSSNTLIYGCQTTVIPNSVTSIGDWAFSGCSGLTSVTIPNSVTSIGNSAFCNCSGLTSVIIPNSVTSILDSAFLGCSGLTSVTIPNSVTSIEGAAFAYCSGLTSVTIPNSVTIIGHATFEGCSGLTSVTISNNVTSIGNSAFCYCSGLTSVAIPNSVTSIGDYAFCECSGLISVSIGSGVKNIGSGAFFLCPELLDVYCHAEQIPAAESNTFDGSCIENTTLHVPTASIGHYQREEPWCNFGSMTSLSGDSKKEYVDLGLSSGTLWATFNVGATKPHETGVYLAWGELEEKDDYSLSTYFDKDYTLFNGSNLSICATEYDAATMLWGEQWCMPSYKQAVELYNECSWNWVDNYESSGVSGMKCVGPNGNYIFFPASGLMQGTSKTHTNYGNFWVGEIDKSWTSQNFADFIDFNSDGLINSFFSQLSVDYRYYGRNVRPVVKSNAPLESETQKEIGGINYEFNVEANEATVIARSDEQYSGDVVIPETVDYVGVTYSVTSIGDSAFYECGTLSSVVIPNSVVSIGGDAFSYCYDLTSVHIPNSITSIGERAFYDCSSLTYVTIPNSLTTIDRSTFGSCKHLKNITLPSGLKKIEYGAFFGCYSLENINLPDGLESIGETAFCDIHGMTSVYIPQSVRYIGPGAFANTTAVTSIVVDANNPVYDSRNNCNAIMETATNKLIAGCSNTIFPDGTTCIGYGAFAYIGLNNPKVVLPNTVQTLEPWAFNGSNIKTIVIPATVSLMDYWSISSHCSSLKEIIFEGETPPTADGLSFAPDATIYVPFGCKKNYDKSPWNRCEIVEIPSSSPSLTIVDGESFENTEERELSVLTYTRTLPNLKWNPLYVPFKIPYEKLADNYDVAYINSMHSYDNDQDGEIEKMTMEVIKIKKGVLKANHPYLIRAKNEAAKQMDLLLEDVTLYPTVSNKLDCSSVYTHFEITGTYKEMTRCDLGGSLVITTDGAWKKLAASSILKPFRFYLTITDREGSPLEVSEDAKSRINICVQGEDDFATGIDEVKLENANAKTAVYDLSGRRVQNPSKGGVYIVNGKKVVF